MWVQPPQLAMWLELVMVRRLVSAMQQRLVQLQAQATAWLLERAARQPLASPLRKRQAALLVSARLLR